MVMYANEVEKKEKEKLSEIKNYLQHIQSLGTVNNITEFKWTQKYHKNM